MSVWLNYLLTFTGILFILSFFIFLLLFLRKGKEKDIKTDLISAKKQIWPLSEANFGKRTKASYFLF